MVTGDWAEGILAIDLIDRELYQLLYQSLDQPALLGGAAAYSLFSQHLAGWYADQRKWVDALVACWADDPEHGPANQAHLDRITTAWQPRAQHAAAALDQLLEEVK